MLRFLFRSCFFLLTAFLSSRSQAAMATGGETFDSAGVKIHYTVEGSGAAVILIHGLTSSALMNWGLPGIIALLAKDHQVIAMDVRGHGQSDKPDKLEAYGVEMVEDVARLMDHLQVKQAHLVGYSMGGMITMKFIVTHPERVLSGTLGGMGWMKEGGLLGKFWGLLGADGRGGPGLAAKSFGALAVTGDELKAVKVPVEVLVGDRDPCRTLYVAPLREARPDWPVVEIAGAGHMNCVVQTQFKDELVKWLAKQK